MRKLVTSLNPFNNEKRGNQSTNEPGPVAVVRETASVVVSTSLVFKIQTRTYICYIPNCIVILFVSIAAA